MGTQASWKKKFAKRKSGGVSGGSSRGGAGEKVVVERDVYGNYVVVQGQTYTPDQYVISKAQASTEEKGITRAGAFSEAAREKFNIQESPTGDFTATVRGRQVAISPTGHYVIAPTGATLRPTMVPYGQSTQPSAPKQEAELFSERAASKFQITQNEEGISGVAQGRKFASGGGHLLSGPAEFTQYRYMGKPFYGSTLTPSLVGSGYSSTPSREKGISGFGNFFVDTFKDIGKSTVKTTGEGLSLQSGRYGGFSPWGAEFGGVGFYEFETFRKDPIKQAGVRYQRAQRIISSPEFATTAGLVLLPIAPKPIIKIAGLGFAGFSVGKAIKKPTSYNVTGAVAYSALAAIPYAGRFFKPKIVSKSTEAIMTRRGESGTLTSISKATYNIKIGRRNYIIKGTGLETASPINKTKASAVTGRYLYDTQRGTYGLQNVGGFRYQAPLGSTSSLSFKTVLFSGTKKSSVRLSPIEYALYETKRGRLAGISYKKDYSGELAGVYRLDFKGRSMINFNYNPEIGLHKYAAVKNIGLPHELIHVRQNVGAASLFYDFAEHKLLPYRLRGSEIAAYGLERTYAKRGFKVSVTKPKVSFTERGFMRIDQAFSSSDAGLNTYQIVGVSSSVGKGRGLFGMKSRLTGVQKGYLKEMLQIEDTTFAIAKTNELRMVSKRGGIKFGIGYPKNPYTGSNLFRWFDTPSQGSTFVQGKGDTAISNIVLRMNQRTTTTSSSIGLSMDRGALATAKALFRQDVAMTGKLGAGLMSGSASKTLYGLKSRQRGAQKQSIFTIKGTDRAGVLIPSPKSVTSSKSQLKSIITTRTTAGQVQKTGTRYSIQPMPQQEQRLASPGSSRSRIPLVPPPPPPPSIMVPPFGFEGGRRRTAATRSLWPSFSQPFKYTSSFGASAMGIFGKRPRRLTGLEIRPMTRRRRR